MSVESIIVVTQDHCIISEVDIKENNNSESINLNKDEEVNGGYESDNLSASISSISIDTNEEALQISSPELKDNSTEDTVSMSSASVSSASVSPALESPAPGSLAPESSALESPAPESSGLESPAPETSFLQSPTSESSALESPASESPTLESPAPESLAVETLALVSPALVSPALESPAPAEVTKAVKSRKRKESRNKLCQLAESFCFGPLENTAFFRVFNEYTKRRRRLSYTEYFEADMAINSMAAGVSQLFQHYGNLRRNEEFQRLCLKL